MDAANPGPLTHARSYKIGLWAGIVLAVVSHAAEPMALSGRTMGTTWSAKIVATALEVKTIERNIQTRLDALEQIFSTYRSNSELMRFNAAANRDWIGVSRDLALVAAESQRISALTAGAFDPTVLPLLELWGLGASPPRTILPTPTEIESSRAQVNWQNLEVRAAPPALRKTSVLLRADFSSVAKGFAADAVSEMLGQQGIGNYLVQIGGDTRAAGPGPRGDGWRVAIERAEAPTIADTINLSNESLSTSGNYRNFVLIEGRQYGHIIDPRTGRPVTSSLAAVSVIHVSCLTSSGLATALFVLGEEEGFRLAERERVAALFIIRQNGELALRPTRAYQQRK